MEISPGANMTNENPSGIGAYEIVEGQLKTRRELLMLGALAAGSAVAATSSQALAEGTSHATAAVTDSPAVAYKAKDFSHLLVKPSAGLTTAQIEPHLKLYAGYVAKA